MQWLFSNGRRHHMQRAHSGLCFAELTICSLCIDGAGELQALKHRIIRMLVSEAAAGEEGPASQGKPATWLMLVYLYLAACNVAAYRTNLEGRANRRRILEGRAMLIGCHAGPTRVWVLVAVPPGCEVPSGFLPKRGLKLNLCKCMYSTITIGVPQGQRPIAEVRSMYSC